MSRDFWLGVAAIPALAALIFAIYAVRQFAVHRIQRLHGANTPRRAALAARVYSARRAYVWAARHIAISITLGHDWSDSDRAEAVLLDEFDPRPDTAPGEATP